MAPGPPLSAEDARRYARQLALPGFGEDGQRRLGAARVLVVGAGGLGSPVLLYLAAAGVGTIGVVDADRVEVANLHRQVVHGLDDVGRAKVDSAASALAGLNPGVTVRRHDLRLAAGPAALDLFGGYDLVVDGSDNFPTRYLVADACELLGLPCVWGSIHQFDGQVSVFWARPPADSGVAGFTYRDLHPEPPPPGSVPSCEEAGVLGPVCAAVGSAMALEAVKMITGVGSPALGRLLVLDGLTGAWRTVPLRPRPGRPPVTALEPAGELGDPRASGTVRCPAQAEEPYAEEPDAEKAAGELTPARVSALLDEIVLLDVREPWETQVCSIAGSVAVPMSRWRSLTSGPELTGLLAEATGGRPAVLYCKSGARSGQLLEVLRSSGVPDSVVVGHLSGGILAWIDGVDPRLPRY